MTKNGRCDSDTVLGTLRYGSVDPVNSYEVTLPSIVA